MRSTAADAHTASPRPTPSPCELHPDPAPASSAPALLHGNSFPPPCHGPWTPASSSHSGCLRRSEHGSGRAFGRSSRRRAASGRKPHALGGHPPDEQIRSDSCCSAVTWRWCDETSSDRASSRPHGASRVGGKREGGPQVLYRLEGERSRCKVERSCPTCDVTLRPGDVDRLHVDR
jgi:hypothetical protein